MTTKVLRDVYIYLLYQFISNDLIFIQTKLFCRSSAKVRNCKIMRKKDLIFAGILIGHGYGIFITKEEIS